MTKLSTRIFTSCPHSSLTQPPSRPSAQPLSCSILLVSSPYLPFMLLSLLLSLSFIPFFHLYPAILPFLHSFCSFPLLPFSLPVIHGQWPLSKLYRKLSSILHIRILAGACLGSLRTLHLPLPIFFFSVAGTNFISSFQGY